MENNPNVPNNQPVYIYISHWVDSTYIYIIIYIPINLSNGMNGRSKMCASIVINVIIGSGAALRTSIVFVGLKNIYRKHPYWCVWKGVYPAFTAILIQNIAKITSGLTVDLDIYRVFPTCSGTKPIFHGTNSNKPWLHSKTSPPIRPKGTPRPHQRDTPWGSSCGELWMSKFPMGGYPKTIGFQCFNTEIETTLSNDLDDWGCPYFRKA